MFHSVMVVLLIFANAGNKWISKIHVAQRKGLWILFDSGLDQVHLLFSKFSIFLNL